MDDLEACLGDIDQEDHCAESRTAPQTENHRDVETIKIPRSVILEEIVKSLNGNISSREHHTAVDGVFVTVKAHIPAPRLGADAFKVTGHSCVFFTTKSEARESVSERMINLLKKKFKLETDDMNWGAKNEQEFEKASLKDHIKKLMEENALPKEFITSVVDGWAYYLQLAESVYKMSETMCICACASCDAGGTVEDINRAEISTQILRDYTKLVWAEGVRTFDWTLTTRQGIYVP